MTGKHWTPPEVKAEIRRLANTRELNQREIGERFDLTQSAVSRIVRNPPRPRIPANAKARLLPEAQRLSGEGLNYTEIGEKLGVLPSTVGQWLRDPTGEKARSYAAERHGTCRYCGGPTSDPRSSGCKGCAWWTEEEIVEALKRFAEEHGRPPKRTEWGDPDSNRPVASASTVENHFGSWTGALAAAGMRSGADRLAETQEAIEAEVRDGKPVTEIAEDHGVTPGAIYRRFALRGISVRELRP